MGQFETSLWLRAERIKLRAPGNSIYGCGRGGQDVGPREQKEFSSSAECSIAGGGVSTLHLQKGPATMGGSTEACGAVGTASWALTFLPIGCNITSARGGSAKEREQGRVIWGVVCES